MTWEELKRHCEKQIEECERWAKYKGEEPHGKIYEEHKLILELLEQEPCEDAVSRKAVLNLARDLEFSKIKGMENYKHRCIEIEDVEELPSVMPDLSSLREINEALTKRVQFLETMNRYATPATSTRKKGKWVKTDERGFGYEEIVICECSECGNEEEFRGYFNGVSLELRSGYNYCPNCGAEMEEQNDNNK